MNEQQIIEYLRSKSSSSKALGVAKNRTVEDFFVEHNITIRCPNCLSPKKVENGTNDSGIARYKCKDCGKGYSIVTNTIFEGSPYSVDEVINAVHVVLSKYLQVRKARGYVDADDIYHTLTQEEYDKNERINQQLYKEKIYPYVENSGRDLSFHKLSQIKNKFGLTVNGVNGFHSDIQRLLNAV